MIISPSQTKIRQSIETLARAFQVKDLGKLTKFLGINIDRKPDGIRINQEDKITTLCEDMGMLYCKGAFTPIADDNIIDANPSQLCTEEEATKYRSAT
ncbi:hypothetical protein K3495_g12560 [Podosphaera aphanis]|nr:hypothetical protein K3495_g12560 [Podosphaera aphanis]